MKIDFKALLGEKYTDEIAIVLDGISEKLLPNDGSYIPKIRFDQVNEKLKAAQEEAEKVRVSKLSEDEKNAEKIAKADATIKEFTIKSNKLEVEKVFVNAGIKDYAAYIDNIVGENLETSLSVAKSIAKTVTDSLTEKNAEIEKLKLLGTPQPPVGGSGEPKKPNKLNYTELAELKANNPTAYDAYIATQSTE